jgi:hypothetical protein
MMSKWQGWIALIAGLTAGTLATLVQMALWWAASVPVWETLLRDARLTAAILLGPAVLPPPTTWRLDVMLVASVIHFALSIGYAIPAGLTSRLRLSAAIPVGGLYGLAIYIVNLYGFTLLFPWFTVSRGWITLLTHVVFGISLCLTCKLISNFMEKTQHI